MSLSARVRVELVETSFWSDVAVRRDDRLQLARCDTVHDHTVAAEIEKKIQWGLQWLQSQR